MVVKWWTFSGYPQVHAAEMDPEVRQVIQKTAAIIKKMPLEQVREEIRKFIDGSTVEEFIERQRQKRRPR